MSNATTKPAPPTKAERESIRFAPATAKFTIGSLDDTNITVSAQYNPKEVSVVQPVTWKQHAKKAKESDHALHFEFGAQSPRKFTVELIFDGVENVGRIGREGSRTVEGEIVKLQSLIDLHDNTNDKADLRPHFCVVVWGNGGLPALSCVIENMTTKYEAFTSMGLVTRATVTLSIMEAYRVDLKSEAKLVAKDAYKDVRSMMAQRATGYSDKGAAEIYEQQRTWRKEDRVTAANEAAEAVAKQEADQRQRNAARGTQPQPTGDTPAAQQRRADYVQNQLRADDAEEKRGQYVRSQLAADEAE